MSSFSCCPNSWPTTAGSTGQGLFCDVTLVDEEEVLERAIAGLAGLEAGPDESFPPCQHFPMVGEIVFSRTSVVDDSVNDSSNWTLLKGQCAEVVEVSGSGMFRLRRCPEGLESTWQIPDNYSHFCSICGSKSNNARSRGKQATARKFRVLL